MGDLVAGPPMGENAVGWDVLLEEFCERERVDVQQTHVVGHLRRTIKVRCPILKTFCRACTGHDRETVCERSPDLGVMLLGVLWRRSAQATVNDRPLECSSISLTSYLELAPSYEG